MTFRPAILVAVLAFLALLSRGPGAAAADAFVPGFDDLPLMAGLTADDQLLVFDTAAGRIVQSQASGALSQSAVLAFYDRALPQLGWTATDIHTFIREEEILRIEFPEPAGPAGQLIVRFALTPKGGS